MRSNDIFTATYSPGSDPLRPVATKPLCFRQNGQAATFLTHDGNKNVTDMIRVAPHNDSVGHYDYAPFGAVTAQTGSRAATNPYRFSSEFVDDTLGLVYYNYRHYEPTTGRWLSRDPVFERAEFDGRIRLQLPGGLQSDNLYLHSENSPIMSEDVLGLLPCSCKDENKCRNWCDGEIMAGGFISGNYRCSTTLWVVVQCKCWGWCEHLIMSRIPTSRYEKWECTYRCGFKTAFFRLDRPCPLRQVIRLPMPY